MKTWLMKGKARSTARVQLRRVQLRMYHVPGQHPFSRFTMLNWRSNFLRVRLQTGTYHSNQVVPNARSEPAPCPSWGVSLNAGPVSDHPKRTSLPKQKYRRHTHPKRVHPSDNTSATASDGNGIIAHCFQGETPPQQEIREQRIYNTNTAFFETHTLNPGNSC